MDEAPTLAKRFEEHRGHLRAVAYRMLGSLSEADDAVQEAWLRLSRSDASHVDNLRGWLTTVVARICLDLLRARRSRHEEPLEAHVPDPVVTYEDGSNPEHQTLLAEAIGLAMLVVLDRLSPAERLAFVLHDVFAVPFEEIALLVGRSPTAARQLASRARRRVRGADRTPDTDVRRQREVVDAFFAAVRNGDFQGLLTVLDPDVVLRADLGVVGASRVVRGAAEVARQTRPYSGFAGSGLPVLVNGAPGVLGAGDGRIHSVMAFAIRGGRIVEIDILSDPERLSRLDLSGLDARPDEV